MCRGCGHKKESIDPFYLQSIKIKDKKTVQEGLEHHVQGEIINDFQCDNCNKRVDLTSKTVLKTLPNMMIIHM